LGSQPFGLLDEIGLPLGGFLGSTLGSVLLALLAETNLKASEWTEGLHICPVLTMYSLSLAP